MERAGRCRQQLGGNMAAVVALMAKARACLRSAQVLSWPVTPMPISRTRPYDEFATALPHQEHDEWFWDAYTTDPKQRQEIYASPLLASAEQLRAFLPPWCNRREGCPALMKGEAYARSWTPPASACVPPRYNG